MKILGVFQLRDIQFQLVARRELPKSRSRRTPNLEAEVVFGHCFDSSRDSWPYSDIIAIVVQTQRNRTQLFAVGPAIYGSFYFVNSSLNEAQPNERQLCQLASLNLRRLRSLRRIDCCSSKKSFEGRAVLSQHFDIGLVIQTLHQNWMC